jgi:hypothetical protein
VIEKHGNCCKPIIRLNTAEEYLLINNIYIWRFLDLVAANVFIKSLKFINSSNSEFALNDPKLDTLASEMELLR